MEKVTAKQAVEMIRSGEDPDDAYDRIYANQCKPCDFRRWFGLLKQGVECLEVSLEMRSEIKSLIEEGFDDHSSFLEIFPDYVTRADFQTAWIKSRRMKRAALAVQSGELASEVFVENSQEVPSESTEPFV